MTDPALECDVSAPWGDPLFGVPFMAWQDGSFDHLPNPWEVLKSLASFGFPQKVQHDTSYPALTLPVVPLWVNWIVHACIESKVSPSDVFGAAPLFKIRDAAAALGHDAWARSPKQFLVLLRGMLGRSGDLVMAAARLGGPDAAAAVLRRI